MRLSVVDPTRYTGRPVVSLTVAGESSNGHWSPKARLAAAAFVPKHLRGNFMHYTPELNEELDVLILYNLSTTLEGLKVHKTAGAAKIAAVHRLYEKGLVTQPDGGYLTDLGREAAEHAQAALTILTSTTG